MPAQIDTSYGLFLHDLKALFYLERRLEDELEMMAKEVTNDKLSDALIEHRDETSKHVTRLKKVFDTLGVEPKEHEAADFEGIFEEADELNENIDEVDLINLAFLNTAKKVEHIEISCYRALLDMADRFDLDDDVEDLLEENLDDEEEALDDLEDLSEKSWWNKLVDGMRA